MRYTRAIEDAKRRAVEAIAVGSIRATVKNSATQVSRDRSGTKRKNGKPLARHKSLVVGRDRTDGLRVMNPTSIPAYRTFQRINNHFSRKQSFEQNIMPTVAYSAGRLQQLYNKSL
jgi:hypothetical protein